MSMKITAGLGSIDDYITYAKAGADEVFIGYVPERWTNKYGIMAPLNRREVLYYNVQIGSRSELEILHDMYLVYKIPVQIALNALYYQPEQYPLVVDIMKECVEIGFDSFIVADMGLIYYLNKLQKEAFVENRATNDELFNNVKVPMHIDWLSKIHLSISGELSEMNAYLARQLVELGADRIIFHRYTSLESMKKMTESLKVASSQLLSKQSDRNQLEFEAFVLNEKCHFNGAYCNSLHCDELCHMCRVPYKKEVPDKNQLSPAIEMKLETSLTSTDDMFSSEDFHLIGESGCGLCALWDLQIAGVTHLKVVGRGNYSDDMLHDIKALKKALAILQASASKNEFIKTMKENIFPNGCSGECYY